MVYEIYNSGEFDRDIEYYTCIDKIIKRISLVMADLEKGKFIAPSDKCRNDFALLKGYLMNAENHGYKFVYEYSDKKKNGAWNAKYAIVSKDCHEDADKLEELLKKGYFMEIPDAFREFMAFVGIEFPYCLVVEKDGEQDG